LVIADEPTSELDHRSGNQVLAVLSEAAAAGSAVVVSTHDERVLAVADRVLQLRHGVLSGERVGSGQAWAAIDPTGRVQLPPEALERFPTGRALLTIEDDAVVLRPPEEAR
jgi:putative ABC transport system ATP-binding protein